MALPQRCEFTMVMDGTGTKETGKEAFVLPVTRQQAEAELK